MATMLDDTMNTAKNMMETAKEGTEHAVTKTRTTFLEGFHAVAQTLAMLRSLDRDDALGWVGLARRKSPFESIALFGAGMAVGAGVGMLLSPMSGAKLRRKLFGALKGEGQEVADRVQSTAKDLEEKGEDLVHKAGDAAKKVERKIEQKVTAGVDAVKDGVNQKVDAAKQAVDDLKAEAPSPGAHTKGPNTHSSSPHRPS